MAGHQIDQDDFAAERLDDLAADHLLGFVVAALDQHRRLDACDQLFRRVLIEHHHEIDRLERSEVKLPPIISYTDYYVWLLVPAALLLALSMLLSRTVFLRLP